MGKKLQLDEQAIGQVLEKALVMRLGLCRDNEPYVVPLNFAFHEGAIYFHSSLTGRKMDMLRANPRVCFEVDVDAGLLKPMDPDDGCSFGMRYKSVIGHGTAVILEDPEEKVAGLKALLAHYTDHDYDLPEDKVKRTAVVRIDIESMTGKADG